MKSDSKVQLSAYEMELVTNAGILLTKNSVILKTKQLLAQLLVQQQDFLLSKKDVLPEVIIKSTPKISKGEQYKGLPYLVLDYPRLFEGQDILTVRTIFWWGNFFSTTLHLAGNYKKKATQQIIDAILILKDGGFWFCVNSDSWEHDFESGNYILISEISEPDLINLIRERPFIKIAHKIPLLQWDEAGKILLQQFKTVMHILRE